MVDDTPANREILEQQTAAWGMVPVAVSSGQEALDLLRSDSDFDLAILDLHMPGMDGLSLAAAIRGLRGEAELPLVLLSSVAHTADDERERLFAARMTKPVKASQLYNSLVGVLATELAEDQHLAVAGPGAGASEFEDDLASRLPLRLLLVEDNTTNQEIACLLLERLGYRADVAANGLEALDAVQRQDYDVVLMDLQMPEMDGLEATRRIRRDLPAATQPRIVAMTANALAEDRDECLAAGMDDYVSKPVRINELVAALRRVADGPDGGAAAPEGEPPGEDVGGEGPPEEGGAPVLDPQRFNELLASLGSRGEAMVPRLIAGFGAEAPKLLATARAALEARDAEALRRAAHTLKGNALNFGLVALSEAARDLEYCARDSTSDSDLDAAGDLLNQVEDRFGEAQAALLEAGHS